MIFWLISRQRRAINRRLGRPRASPGGVLVEFVALVLILYGIASCPWLIVPAAIIFALAESAARTQRAR